VIGTLFGVIAYASSVVIGTVPPHPAMPFYCNDALRAAGTESATEGLRDVAVVTMYCDDMALDKTLDVRVDFVWWYSATVESPMYRVPGCPSASSSEVRTPPLPGVLTITRSAACEQPASSPGFGQVRTACAHFTINGEDFGGYSPYDNGLCVVVPVVER
jgi:hypothetical protein